MRSTLILLVEVCIIKLVLAETPLSKGSPPKTKATMGSFKECCPSIPSIVPDEVFKDCMTFKPNSTNKRPTVGSCVMECAFDVEGLLTNGPDGRAIVNMAAFNATVAKLAVGAWAPILTSARDNCTAFPLIARNGQMCTSGANDLAQCMTMHFVTNCPSSNTSDICSKRTERMKNTQKRQGWGQNRNYTTMKTNVSLIKPPPTRVPLSQNQSKDQTKDAGTTTETEPEESSETTDDAGTTESGGSTTKPKPKPKPKSSSGGGKGGWVDNLEVGNGHVIKKAVKPKPSNPRPTSAKTTTAAATAISTTPVGTTVATTPVGTTVATTPVGTTVATTSVGTTVATTSAATTVATTSAATTVSTTAATTLITTEAATTSSTTPQAQSGQ